MTKKNFAVLGLGRFGKNIALTLEQMGYNVLGVDKDETVAANLAENLTRVVSFDIRDARALQEAGISNFDTVIIASKNLEASLMATMLCKELEVAEIIVKAIDERHGKMAERLGASKVIFSERDTARRVALQLVSPNAFEHLDIGADIKMLGLPMPPKLVGKTLIEANLRNTANVNVIAVTSENETIVTPPFKHVFKADEQIFVIGTPVALAKFEQSMDI